MKKFTPDQERVCEYLQEIAPDIGCGIDPIGFLIASHNYLRSLPRTKTMPTDTQVAIEAMRAYRKCADTLESIGLEPEAERIRHEEKKWNELFKRLAEADDNGMPVKEE